MRTAIIMVALSLASLLAACDQDKRTADMETKTEAAMQPTAGQEPQHRPEISLVTIAAGGGKPVDEQSPVAAKYDGDPEQIAAGRQLYTAYNCVGCHFNGGGGMGPALMDDQWIYGSSMENIASTIREGRPRGMPNFRAMVTDEQVWQLAAYVRSLSGLGSRKTQ